MQYTPVPPKTATEPKLLGALSKMPLGLHARNTRVCHVPSTTVLLLCQRYSGGDLLILLGLVVVGFSLPYLLSHAGSVVQIVATYAIPCAIAFVAIAYESWLRSHAPYSDPVPIRSHIHPHPSVFVHKAIHKKALGLDHEGANSGSQAWGGPAAGTLLRSHRAYARELLLLFFSTLKTPAALSWHPRLWPGSWWFLSVWSRILCHVVAIPGVRVGERRECRSRPES